MSVEKSIYSRQYVVPTHVGWGVDVTVVVVLLNRNLFNANHHHDGKYGYT